MPLFPLSILRGKVYFVSERERRERAPVFLVLLCSLFSRTFPCSNWYRSIDSDCWFSALWYITWVLLCGRYGSLCSCSCALRNFESNVRVWRRATCCCCDRVVCLSSALVLLHPDGVSQSSVIRKMKSGRRKAVRRARLCCFHFTLNVRVTPSA